MKKTMKKVNVKTLCPFDDLPCDYVDSCDDALSLATGFNCVEGSSCPRAVFKVRKSK